MREEPQPSGEGNARDGAVATYPLAGYVVDGRVRRDVMCSHCGYNLRTLACDARCPECGSLVSGSLRRLDLRYADPQWLRRITRGLLHATLLPPIVLLCSLLLMILTREGGGLTGTWNATRVAGMSLLWLVGTWGFTMPEPLGAEQDGARKMARVVTYLSACLALACFVLPRDVSANPWVPLAMVVANFLNATVVIAYAIVLCGRIPLTETRPGLVKILKLLIFAVVIAALSGVFAVTSGLGWAKFWAACVSITLLVLSAILIEVYMLRLAIQLTRTTAAARRMASV